MAGDWIKMRTDLYRDPKVCMIADSLLNNDGELARYVNQNTQRDMTVTRNVMRNVVVGALVAVWGVSRHRGKRRGDDLVMSNCSAAVVDDIAELLGFGDAMASVGWVVEEQEYLVFPRFFEEFNVEPKAESKAKNAERQRRHRERNRNALRNGDVTLESNAREEKRREEKKDPPNPPVGGDSSHETKPKKKQKPAGEHPSFAGFWSAYPKKTARPKAAQAFNQISPDETLLASMLAALARHRLSPDWTKEGGRFIPHPATWLNQRRWEDQPPEIKPPPMTPPSTRYAVYDEIPMPPPEVSNEW